MTTVAQAEALAGELYSDPDTDDTLAVLSALEAAGLELVDATADTPPPLGTVAPELPIDPAPLGSLP